MTIVQTLTLQKAISATTLVISFGTTPTSGNELIVALWCWVSGASAQTLTLSDNQSVGNKYYTDVFAGDSNGGKVFIFRCPSVKVGLVSPFKITATMSASGDILGTVFELNAASGGLLGCSGVNNGTTTSLDTQAMPIPGAAVNFVVAVGLSEGAGTTLTFTANAAGSSPSTGYTNDVTDGNNSADQAGVVAHLLSSSAAAFRHVWTCSASGFACSVIAAYGPAGNEIAVNGRPLDRRRKIGALLPC